MSLLLGVNIDHVATLRQARYALNPEAPIVEPCVLEAAREAKEAGADSITIHVREDKRHMQPEDAWNVRREIDLPLNLEMANTTEMVSFSCELKPDFVCIVPEKREEVTTEGGLDVLGSYLALKENIAKIQAQGIKVSLFIDPDPEQIQASAKLGVEMIELHTGAFALTEGSPHIAELERLKQGATLGHGLGLQVNAGHGIHPLNIDEVFTVPHLVELNIGHSIIARAMIVGLRMAVIEMRELMSGYSGGHK